MSPTVESDIQLESIISGYDGETCWVHARAGAIPGAGRAGAPAMVMTMQKLLLSGSDVFYTIHDLRTDDMGETWSGPTPHPGFGRWQEEGGIEACVCDFTPKWHAPTGVLLGIGHTARYQDRSGPMAVRRREAAYAVYDEQAGTWSDARFLELPDEAKFVNAGSGCTQRVDLEDGTVLLPIYFRPDPEVAMCRVTVARCAFDGTELSYLEHGDELACPDPRGMAEPSLTRFQDRFHLTLRNDLRGYVAVGDDGLHFEEPIPWRFDDEEELGNYNTQQHWLTHSDALFLIYTRCGASNDHVFRHRAPLFVAEDDPDRLCVIRDTERIAIPERGARLGNFGVTEVTEEESWIIAAEWMQPAGCEQYGSDNTVWAARVRWDRPNRSRR